MKKFYSIIAAATLGSMISASAFTSIDRIEKVPGKNLRNVDVEKLEASKQQAHSFAGVSSRADGDPIDITTFTQSLYYDYFFNWYEDVAGTEDQEELESFRNLRSSNEVEIVDNGNGTFTINGYGGYNVFNPTLYITEDGGLAMEMGEVLFQGGQYTYVLAAISEDDQYMINGEILPLNIYTNAIEPDVDFMGVLALRNGTTPVGWQFLSVGNLFMAPNATLSYSRTTTDQFGNNTTVDISNRIYAEFIEANPQAEPGTFWADDHIMVSNVTPYNMGVSVYFTVVGDMIYALESIAIASETDDDGINTGNYYLSTFWMDGSDLYYDNVVIVDSPSETELIWPVPYEGLLPGADFWTIMAETGYWAGQLTGATLTLDSDEGNGEDGITDIIKDNSDNTPAVYYNLQGVEVANPAVGQIYIVKNGNKVSKQIIK